MQHLWMESQAPWGQLQYVQQLMHCSSRECREQCKTMPEWTSNLSESRNLLHLPDHVCNRLIDEDDTNVPSGQEARKRRFDGITLRLCEGQDE